MGPLDVLRHHVTGAIERGEAAAIVERRPDVSRAFIAVQCSTPDGEKGTFLYSHFEERWSPQYMRRPVPVSPVFPDLATLLPWMKENGWEQETAGLLSGYVKGVR